MANQRENLTQQEKYVAFRKAYGMVNDYQREGNYIGAYVIAYSLLEDRIRAMFVIYYRATQEAEPKQDKIDDHFKKIISKLVHHQYLDEAFANKVLDEANRRNELLHAAMWKLDAFTEKSVADLKAIVREADNRLKKKKRELGIKGRIPVL